MRRTRAFPLLGLVALVVAAFVVPAAASAAQWTYEGEPLQEAAEFDLQGFTEVVPNGGWGYRCDDVNAQLAVEPGDQGAIDNIAFSECNMLGSFTGLQAVVTPNNLPWAVEASGNIVGTDEVSVTVAAYYWYQTPGVDPPVVQWSEVRSMWDLAPDNPEAVSDFLLTGYNFDAMQPENGGFAVSPSGVLGL